MNICIQIWSILLLCITSSLSQKPLIPACPVYKYDPQRSCYDSCFEYGYDTCPDDLKCCYDYCGNSYCETPIYIDDTCPSVYNGSITSCLTGCYDENGIDICEAQFQLCCYDYYNSCPYCADPVSQEYCPDYFYEPCYFTCFDEFGKDTCPSGEICCYDQCGEYCTKPDYYRVLCPNESILEADEPYQRQTSFCIEDCDCEYFAQICCESPCGCELDICRYPVIQKAECPSHCSYDYYYSSCGYMDYCYQSGKLCCDGCYGYKICQTPEFVDGPDYLWEIGNPEIP